MMNEIKYDVFISFKNTDKDNQPTLDSEIAQKIYKELEQRNIQATLFNPLQILLEFGSRSYVIHRRAGPPSSHPHRSKSCQGPDRLSSSLLPGGLLWFRRSAHLR